MGRLWAHVILIGYHPAFEVVLFESLIKENQKEYYRAREEFGSRWFTRKNYMKLFPGGFGGDG